MLFLASQSPRRRELLAQTGLDFEVLDVEVPELRVAGEPAFDYVRRVAREKAGAGLMTVAAVPGALILGADTEVVLDGEVFGKPRDADAAARMLARLSGRTHQVLSAVALINAGCEWQAQCASSVSLAALGARDIDAYIASGEWQGKAGGYAIQGRAAAFISRLEGSYSAVMGLPLYETWCLLNQAKAAPGA